MGLVHNSIRKGIPKMFFTLIYILFMLLLSYYLVLNAQDFSSQQTEVMLFLEGRGELQNYNERETEHLKDVKNLMDAIDIAFILLIIGMIVSLHYIGTKALAVAGIIGIIFGAMIGIGSFVIFSVLFDYFHMTFFTSGSWIFPSGSKLVSLFTFDFFERITKSILIVNILLNVIVLIVLQTKKWYDNSKL